MVRLPKSVVAQRSALLCVLLARGAQADSLKAAVVETSSLAGDAVALIQQKKEARFRKSAAGSTAALVRQEMEARFMRSAAGSSLVRESSALKGEPAEAELPADLPLAPLMGPAECAAHPTFCKAPFDCHKTPSYMATVWDKVGWAPDGKPNWRSFCYFPHYDDFAGKCAAGDIVGAGLVQYQLGMAGAFGPDFAELDGSWCFMDGHCVDTTVSNSTTLDEMVEMCDKRFGRENWATFGAKTAPPENMIGWKISELHGDYSNGFSSPEQTRPWLLKDCAQGLYHCDVMFCKKNMCQNDYFRNKYGHLLKKYGWTE